MLRISSLTWLAAVFALVLTTQTAEQTVAGGSPGSCRFAGTYRIDPAASDRLYSVLTDVTRRMPAAEQQQFFSDLSTRLTPPDLLALECDGRNVSVGSSRAPKLTFLADGRSRTELRPNGTRVDARVTMSKDTLTFASSGRAEDSVNVSFLSIDNGRRLRVTRHIYARQLNQPVVVETVYDKIADEANWNFEGDPLVAKRTQIPDHQLSGADKGDREAEVLERALYDWIQATNQRDIDRQMSYYMPRLQAYYLTRNTPTDVVRREKQQVFLTASLIDIRAGEPEIIFQDGGRTAIMRFRKQYRIDNNSRSMNGEVIQELRWQRANGQWLITSERDIRVLR